MFHKNNNFKSLNILVRYLNSVLLRNREKKIQVITQKKRQKSINIFMLLFLSVNLQAWIMDMYGNNNNNT